MCRDIDMADRVADGIIVLSDSDSENEHICQEVYSLSSDNDEEYQEDLKKAMRNSLLQDNKQISPMEKVVISVSDSGSDNEMDAVSSLDDGSSPVKYLHDDSSVPFYSKSTHYTYHDAVKIILECNDDKVCSKHPIRVEENAAFVVDLGKLQHADDIKADDSGHWIHNGRKSTKVAVKKNHGRVTHIEAIKSTLSDENSELYTLVRVYYVHDPHSDFKRIYYYLYGKLIGS
jgi:hypothetical protein